MSLSNIIIHPAEITGTDPDNRVIDILWKGLPGGVRNVMLVSDTGDFSFPKIGDVGLVIQYSTQSYYLGKIEYGYKQQISGTTVEPDSNTTIIAKRVLEGEIYLANLLKRTWLSITGSGDFSLLNQFTDGLRYYLTGRILRLSGMVTRLMGNGVTLKVGSVMRDSGAITDIISQELPTIPSVEACLEVLYQSLKIARLHLGHIKSAVAPGGVGVDEVSTLGGKLRAILEVGVGPLIVASLKMDEQGNIELTSLAGKIFIDTSTPKGIMLGGLSAIHRALLGEPFLLHYKVHTHGSAVGPTSPPIVPVIDEVVLSQKVKLI